ncbi:MAG: hypothetical protein LBQ47_02830 [Endomicrobium sp.]|jgi:hypothetical protein|nr:hypothetical protein [Endomicrobium sp.]
MNYYENIILKKLLNGVYNASARKKIIAHLRPEFIREAKQLIKEAKAKIGLGDTSGIKYRKIRGKEAREFERITGLQAKGKTRKITKTDVRHLLKHGMASKENPRGQASVIERDFLLIPHITKHYDNLTLEPEKSENKPVVKYVKTLDKKKYYYYETVGGKHKKDFRPKTMFKKK